MAGRSGQLGPSGEQAWASLRQHAAWAQGFWVAWLFTGHPGVAHALEARMAQLLEGRGQHQIILAPDSPEEVRRLLEILLSDETRSAHCIWVEVVRSDRIGQIDGPWAEAWDWLMMRANERRGLLSAHLPGGLIFAGVPAFKTRSAQAAPDLWSIRALVLEPAPPAGPPAENILAHRPIRRTPWPTANGDPALALAQAERMRRSGSRSGEAIALMRSAEGALAQKDLDRAMDAARQAEALFRALARDAPRFTRDWARSLHLLASILRETGSRDQALAASEEATALWRELAQAHPQRHAQNLAWSLGMLAHDLREAGRSSEALAASEEAVALWLDLLAQEHHWGSPHSLAEGLIDLFFSLLPSGRKHEAVAALEKSVSIYRSRAQDAPALFRPGLAASLHDLSNMLSVMGRLSEALAAGEEAVEIWRELAQDDPARFLPDLEAARAALSSDLREAGYSDDTRIDLAPAPEEH